MINKRLSNLLSIVLSLATLATANPMLAATAYADDYIDVIEENDDGVIIEEIVQSQDIDDDIVVIDDVEEILEAEEEVFEEKIEVIKDSVSDCVGEHTLSETSIIKKATPEADGEVSVKCIVSDCSYEGTEAIPMVSGIRFVSSPNYTYDGEAKEPAVIVKDSSGNTLSDNCYAVEYEDNINASDAAKAIVTLSGDRYEGSKILEFSIAKVENAPNSPSANIAVRVSASINKVKHIELPAGWEWKGANRETDIPTISGDYIDADAEYVSEDKINYSNLVKAVKITNLGCLHEGYRKSENYHVDSVSSCTVDGSAHYECPVCHQIVETVRLKANGHSFTKYVSQNDATCTEDGTEVASCDNGCGDKNIRTVSGSALGHDLEEGSVTKKATPVADGEFTKNCKRACGHKEVVVIPMASKISVVSGGSLSYDKLEKKPAIIVKNRLNATVSSDEYTVNYSNNINAGDTAEAIITFKGDRYEGSKTVYFTIEKATIPDGAPISTMGVQVEPGKKVSDLDLPANWSWSEDTKDLSIPDTDKATIEAVAEYTGSDVANYEIISVTITITATTCDHDGYRVSSNFIIDKAADCTEAGSGHYICPLCGLVAETNVEVLPIGHSFTVYLYQDDATCEADGTERAVCDNGCGESDSRIKAGTRLEHILDSGIVTTKATPETVGVLTKTCTMCGEYTETEEIPAVSNIDFVSVPSYTYDKTEKEPAVLVRDSAMSTISAANYRVTYTNNINAGVNTAKATVTFIGDIYSGSKDLIFSIGKASYPDNKPSAVMSTSEKIGKKVKDLTLPTGWEWIASAKDILIPTAGSSITVSANYVAADASNYSNISATITITATACMHSEDTYIEADIPATCSENGIGKMICRDCGATVSSDVVIPALGHNWGPYKSNGDATTEADGTKTRVCLNDPSHTETVPDPGSKKPIIRDIAVLAKIEVKDLMWSKELKSTDITVTINDVLMVEGVDYKVIYNDESPLEIGKHKVTIAGIGDYEGSVTKEYEVIGTSFESSGGIQVIRGKEFYVISINLVEGQKYQVEDISALTNIVNSNKSVATINKKGMISAKKAGKATILGKQYEDNYRIVVVVKRVKFPQKKYEMLADSTLNLNMNHGGLMPEYSISPAQQKYATVDEFGVVSAKAAGKVKVIAAFGSKKYTTTVTIFDPVITGPDKVERGKKISLKVKKGSKFTKWTSSDKSIAAVDAKGKVFGKKSGVVTITAINCGRELTKEIEVIVKGE